MNIPDKKILVTGSNGLLGQSIQYVNNGRFNICATGKGEPRIDMNCSDYETMDILNSKECDRVVRSFNPDVVIHAAAMTNVDDCETHPTVCNNINVEGTKNVIGACEKNGVHLIFISTDFIFDGENGPYSEDSKENPLSVYGKSKADAEKLVISSSCKWTIVRTTLVIGYFPGYKSSNIILWARNKLKTGERLSVVYDQVRSPTWSIDLAEGCLLIAEKGTFGIYNLSGPDTMSIVDLVRNVALHGNYDLTLIDEVDSKTLGQAARRPTMTGLDISKAKNEFGYKPHSFVEVLESIPYI